jgi:hypothetical protein
MAYYTLALLQCGLSLYAIVAGSLPLPKLACEYFISQASGSSSLQLNALYIFYQIASA